MCLGEDLYHMIESFDKESQMTSLLMERCIDKIDGTTKLCKNNTSICDWKTLAGFENDKQLDGVMYTRSDGWAHKQTQYMYVWLELWQVSHMINRLMEWCILDQMDEPQSILYASQGVVASMTASYSWPKVQAPKSSSDSCHKWRYPVLRKPPSGT